MKNVTLAVFMLLYLAIPSYANISSVSINDTSFAISGSSFGSSPGSTEWLGQDIEAGENNGVFSETSWVNHYVDKAIYTTNDSHSGDKSILFNFYDDIYSCGIVYDFGQTVREVYLTTWVKLVKNDTVSTFQWKFHRLKDLPGYDHNSGILGTPWYYAGGNPQGEPAAWSNVSIICERDNLQIEDTRKSVVGDGFVFGEWQRIEAHYVVSDTGVANGSYEWRRIGHPTNEIIVSKYDLMTHDISNEDQQYRYIMMGHYYGNLKNADGTDWVGVRDMKIYYDDIYISQTRKRVEIGNNAVFANCTHREIQPALTWADTGITGTFNQGSFETGDTVYFFVIDEDGVASDGYPVTIGGEPSIANPIVEILTESGQTTTASVFTITGTATADTGQTISGVTCEGQTVTPDDGAWDEQEEAFTCLANLALGENTLVFIGSDGARSGSDSVTITRTIPGEYTTRGAGFSIKGCTLK